VLKANFNPNLHLNELNPDGNLYTIVDKTDLIVNSTEFCFLPTGFVEIESVGRVLQPKAGSDALATGIDNELVAQAKATAVYKFYDIYRETNQKQFSGGSLTTRSGSSINETSNGKALELGPEPEIGPASGENEWGGYVALATTAGAIHLSGADLGSSMHVHFKNDFDAHAHLFDIREIASRSQPDLADERVMNIPDRLLGGGDVSYSGPYDPTDGGPGTHRLARSFRLAGGTMTLGSYAPSDLRIDGGYSERHAAPAYYTSTASGRIWDFMAAGGKHGIAGAPAGAVSFWMKPSFAPERTGKIRTLWNLSRYHEPCPFGTSVYPFAMWFLPCHSKPSTAESKTPAYSKSNSLDINYYHPSSISFGSYQWYVPELPKIDTHYFGNITESLNHEGHGDGKPSVLQAHRWVNIAFKWDIGSTWAWGGMEHDGSSSDLYINGSVALEKCWANLADGFGQHGPGIPYFHRHDDGSGPSSKGDWNHMRLGGPSKIGDRPGMPYKGNHSSDCTYDEFYVWNAASGSWQALWQAGRYYKPSGDGSFTSQAFSLEGLPGRILAPASAVAPPPGGAPVPPLSVLGPVSDSIRVLGISWTWYGEGVEEVGASADGEPFLYDYNFPLPGTPTVDVDPKVSLEVLDGLVLLAPPVTGDGFSAIRGSGGGPATVKNPTEVRYRIRVSLPGADLSTILLATPVVDDVTLYWDMGRGAILSYVFDSGSF
jgi:hypothetical protein